MHRRNYRGRKLGREAGPRRALLRSLATSVILYEQVRTTKAKAKEVQPIVEKLITLAKKGDLNATKKLFSYLLSDNAVIKLKTELAPLYKDRNGGYTRVLNAGFRVGDAAPEAIIQLLDTEKIVKKAEEKPKLAKEATKTSSVKATTAKAKETKEEKTKKVEEKPKAVKKTVVKKDK